MQSKNDSDNYKKRIELSKRKLTMPSLIIVYWRDIPAQVIVGKGRRAAKKQLPERFEQAIDRAAMKTGAAGDDAYLAEWRKSKPIEVPIPKSDVTKFQVNSAILGIISNATGKWF